MYFLFLSFRRSGVQLESITPCTTDTRSIRAALSLVVRLAACTAVLNALLPHNVTAEKLQKRIMYRWHGLVQPTTVQQCRQLVCFWNWLGAANCNVVSLEWIWLDSGRHHAMEPRQHLARSQ